MRTIIFFILTSFSSYGQSKFDGLRYDDTKFSLGINIPFGVSTFMYNVRNKWGGLISVVYAGGPGIDDENYISPWHELTSDYIVNHRIISLGLTYRLLRVLHLYSGVGIGWGTRQLIYKDTPPVVLDDAHRTMPSGFKPVIHGGIQITWWRISVGAGFNSYMKAPEFFVGYVFKYSDPVSGTN